MRIWFGMAGFRLNWSGVTLEMISRGMVSRMLTVFTVLWTVGFVKKFLNLIIFICLNLHDFSCNLKGQATPISIKIVTTVPFYKKMLLLFGFFSSLMTFIIP